jgi:hypothetical protein
MYEEHFKPIKLNYFPITPPETPKSKYQSGIRSEIFYMYVRDRRMFDRIDEAKYQFLKEFRVRYMLVTDDRLNETDTYLMRLNIDQVKPIAENVSLVSLKWGD